MTERLWITGIGAVTPLGNGFDSFAENLLAGRSGARMHRIAPNKPDEVAVAPLIEVPPPPTTTAGFERRNLLEQIALSCIEHALTEAGIVPGNGLRIGLVLGMGGEFLRIWELDMLAGGRRVYEPALETPPIVHRLSKELHLGGPAVSVAAACASSGFALGLAQKWVRSGAVDACLAGGCDLITPLSHAAFHNLRALSRRQGPPEAASRPFDRDRDGFVMGEGGTVLLVERESSARRRGATPYGELAGFGTSSDAVHMVIPSEDPKSAARAVAMALDDAELSPEDVDYVNAHATSTPVGDRAEARALQLALGEAVRRTPVSSTKSMTGHLLSGAAAIEAMACLVALRHQAVPPTINLDDPDPDCDLCHVAHHAQQRPVRTAISNSFGFGGSNTCLVLRAA